MFLYSKLQKHRRVQKRQLDARRVREKSRVEAWFDVARGENVQRSVPAGSNWLKETFHSFLTIETSIKTNVPVDVREKSWRDPRRDLRRGD